MRHIEALSEHDMVAAFLQGEIASGRFGGALLALLQRNGRNRRLITAPDMELVVLEGHVRLTAYLLEPGNIPENLTAIIGFSPALDRWMSIQAD